MIGVFNPDTLFDHTHRVRGASSNGNAGGAGNYLYRVENGYTVSYDYAWPDAVALPSVLSDNPGRFGHETAGASVSVLFCISY